MGKRGDKEKSNIEWTLKILKLKYVKELQAIPGRKFRFDYAIPAQKIAIEYEGLFSQKSRHTTIKGFSGDTEKYNLAAIHGWLVLRYTALTYGRLEKDLKQILSERL